MRVERRKPRTAHVGLFGVGFHKYWPQFPGLLEELAEKFDVLSQRVQSYGVDAIDFGIVDDAKSAYALLPRLQSGGS